MDSERIKILDKAKKLKALADRGIGGEKENATRMLGLYMEKHNIKESELNSHRINEDTFRGLTKEEIYKKFEEEMGLKGMFIWGKGVANLMRNRDKLNQFKSKITKPVEINWYENKSYFTIKGYVNGKFIFDIQRIKKGVILYPTLYLKLEKDMNFDTLEAAVEYCNSMKGYFTDIGLNFNM